MISINCPSLLSSPFLEISRTRGPQAVAPTLKGSLMYLARGLDSTAIQGDVTN